MGAKVKVAPPSASTWVFPVVRVQFKFGSGLRMRRVYGFVLLFLMLLIFAMGDARNSQQFRISKRQGDSPENVSSCQCVLPHLCDDYEQIGEDGDTVGIGFEESGCPNYFEVCCSAPRRPVVAEPSSPTCGTQNFPNIGPRITSNSELTQFSELPWTVLVLQKDRKIERNAFICGGSLIHPQVVLTAGHCVSADAHAQIKVRAGEWNIRTKQEPLPHQEISVKEILLHPQFKTGSLWNDIALLFLNKPFKEAANIGFICLASKSIKIDVNSCTVAGWGKNAFNKGRHSAILKKVEVPIVGRAKCQNSLRNTKLGKYFRLHRSFICAGGERNKDACKGDGGSPLICPVPGHEDRYFQMGIVSWGIGCGLSKTPGVYVNVPLYTDWISQSVRTRNFSDAYFTLR